MQCDEFPAALVDIFSLPLLQVGHPVLKGVGDLGAEKQNQPEK